MGSRSGFDANLDLDELLNVVDRGSGAVAVTTRQANAQYNLGLAPSTTALTLGTVAASAIVTVDSNKDVADFRNLSGTNLKAGKDAVAGSLTVFPTTTAKGKLTVTVSDASGNTTTNVNVAAQAAARTYTVPDAGASASFVMTQGAHTVAGAATFTGGVVVSTTGLTVTDVNVILSATTGTKFGTATTQKLSFFNSTPIIQPATAGTATGFTAGGGTTATSTSTFTGNTGTAAYTVGDIVLALKNLGLMAA